MLMIAFTTAHVLQILWAQPNPTQFAVGLFVFLLSFIILPIQDAAQRQEHITNAILKGQGQPWMRDWYEGRKKYLQ